MQCYGGLDVSFQYVWIPQPPHLDFVIDPDYEYNWMINDESFVNIMSLFYRKKLEKNDFVFKGIISFINY